ncbi:DUF4365 domain-containing protein [Kitasatospora sp. NPDC101176]|uniref:DUF4365 domain-containing protein n=1 Tax=Kitasatospora sp. NPDC101176 TaxID=3364099 RepID=UPI00380F0946
MMEELQIGLVTSVAATAGCLVERVGKDLFGMDVRFIRPPTTPLEEEVHLLAQLKSTTQTVPDPAKGWFSYQFSKRAYLEQLAKPRRNYKSILIVMTMPQNQAEWTEVTHEGLLIRRASYWRHLEGVEVSPTVDKPSVRLSTSDIFDAPTLIKLMDRVDREEKLHD